MWASLLFFHSAYVGEGVIPIMQYLLNYVT